MNTPQTRLAGLLALSFGLHLAVLMTWQDHRDFKVTAQELSRPLSLALSAVQKPGREPAPAAKPDKQQRSKPQRIITPRARNHPPAKTHQPHARKPARVSTQQDVLNIPAKTQTPSIAKRNAQSAQTTQTKQEQQASLRARIQQTLLLKFNVHHHYPRVAIRNAWEGRVELGLRVEADGALSNIRVLDSSGYRSLDRAALKSLGQVAVLPDASSWLQGGSIDVILPIIYRLTDG